MTKVIKRGGRTQAFSPAKIRKSVEKAAKKVRLSQEKIRKLVKEVAEPTIDSMKSKKIVKAIDIRKSVIGRIDRRMKSVSGAWRKGEKKKKK